MAGRLTKIWFAAALAVAVSPATAGEMPVLGTKNFVPGGDAPSFFTHGSGAGEDAAASDDGLDKAVERPHAASANRRHGGLAGAHQAVSRAAANSGTGGRRAQSARARTAGRNGRPIGAAARTATTAKGGSIKSGRSGIRHAAARSASRKG
jgi:hypothetical protein